MVFHIFKDFFLIIAYQQAFISILFFALFYPSGYFLHVVIHWHVYFNFIELHLISQKLFLSFQLKKILYLIIRRELIRLHRDWQLYVEMW